MGCFLSALEEPAACFAAAVYVSVLFVLFGVDGVVQKKNGKLRPKE